jgi:hypothetical protein
MAGREVHSKAAEKVNAKPRSKSKKLQVLETQAELFR